MPYSTVDDIRKIIPEDDLIQLTDDEGVGVVNEAVLSEAIDQADREIDAYVGARYHVPLDPVPELIRNLSAQMAVFHLYGRRNLTSEVWESRYKNAIRLLDLIRRGEVTIGAVAGETSTPASGVRFSGNEKKLSSLDMF